MKYLLLLILALPSFGYARDFTQLDSLLKGKIVVFDSTKTSDSICIVSIKIVDEDNMPLQGATIAFYSVKGTEGTETNSKGDAVMLVRKGSKFKKISISFVGYYTAVFRLDVNNDLYLKVKLQQGPVQTEY